MGASQLYPLGTIILDNPEDLLYLPDSPRACLAYDWRAHRAHTTRVLIIPSLPIEKGRNSHVRFEHEYAGRLVALMFLASQVLKYPSNARSGSTELW